MRGGASCLGAELIQNQTYFGGKNGGALRLLWLDDQGGEEIGILIFAMRGGGDQIGKAVFIGSKAGAGHAVAYQWAAALGDAEIAKATKILIGLTAQNRTKCSQ